MMRWVVAFVAIWLTGIVAAGFQIIAPITTVIVGQQVSFGVSGAKGSVKWSTTAPAIATVSGAGVVKGLAPGQATITARSGNLTAWQGVVIRNRNDTDTACVGTTCTVLGTLTLATTLQSISVTAPYTGDSNSNNSATVQYRVTGSGTWLNAYTPYNDRRATLGGMANPYVQQFRGSIVGLTAATSYDVQVTASDADGGSGTVNGSVSTLTSSPPTGGSTITVSDDATLASALSSVNAGQTIHLNSGTYAPFTVSRSGNSGAWIVLDGAGVATVTGLGVAQNVLVSADYVVVKNLLLSASDFSGIIVTSGQHDLIIQGNTLANVSRLCADGPDTTHYGDTGILAVSAVRLFVLSNSITSTSLAACVQTPPYIGPGTGISWANCTTCVVDSNTVTGNFRDGVSSDSSADQGVNVDISNNTVTNYLDDGAETKGDNVHVRMWGNILHSNVATTCIAVNTNTTTNPYGPLYVFRNICHITGTSIAGGGANYKVGLVAPCFLFHNSTDTTSAGVAWSGFAMDETSGGACVVQNNATRVLGSLVEHGGSSVATFDYNIQTALSSWAYLWGGGTTYDTFSDFRTGTGQEAHGANSNPLFTDTSNHIDNTSPAYNTGVTLANFNDANSAWPATHGAPDVGYYEVP